MKHAPDSAADYCRAVASKIKARRIDADLSMNKLGELAGLSQPMIGLIERSVHTPTVHTLFGVSPAEFLASVEARLAASPKKPRARKKLRS